MIQAMTIRNLSHYAGRVVRGTNEDLWSGSSGRHHGKPIDQDFKLNGVALDDECAPADSIYRTLAIAPILTYLSEIGDEWSSGELDENLCHELKKNDPSVEDLVSAAERVKSYFSQLTEEIAAFASTNCRSSAAVKFAVDIKDKEAAKRKALRKYNGDVRRVKDILRARLCFPDEGTLVCGLHHLFTVTKLPNTPGDSKSDATVELARLKNLFRKEFALESVTPSPLPTGYRHLLLNVRFESGLLAGTYFC